MQSKTRVDQLFDGHKFKPSDFPDMDWDATEKLLGGFSEATFGSLKVKFDDEVDQHVKFYSLLAEVRFANVIRPVASALSFVPRDKGPTPDLRATISGQQVEFEVSRLVPENATISSTRMDEIVKAFKLKVQDELKQLTFPVSAVVISPERNWSMEQTYQFILPEVKQTLTAFASVPSVVIHLQYVRPTPGWIILNPKASQQMPNNVSDALVKLGFAKA